MKPIKECEVKIEKIDFYMCERCPKVFLDIRDLAKHAADHYIKFENHLFSAYVKIEKVDILQCDNCIQAFLYSKEYLLHKVKHIHKTIRALDNEKYKLYDNKSLYKPYKCPECDYRFVAKSTLEAHSFVHEPFPHICGCGIGYYKLKDLESHRKLVHRVKVEDTKHYNNNVTEVPKEIIKVKILSKLLKKKPKKKNVNSQHPKGRTPEISTGWTKLPPEPLDIHFPKTEVGYKCPDCKKIVNSKAGAMQHYRSTHRNERPYVCNWCSKTFTQIGPVKAHLTIHSGVKNFSCRYCDKLFYNYHAQERHERTHTGFKPYQCTFCEKSFSDPSAHSRHERIHTGDKRYQCEVCPKAFTDFSALYVHRKRHDITSRDYSCNKCPKSFYTKHNLSLHVNAVHNRNMRFQCDHCKKRFSVKYNLKSHIKRMHSMRKPVKCPICSKLLATKYNLQLHTKNFHDNIKKHTCRHCCKQYFDITSLKRHMWIHSKSRTLKFECDYCSQTFLIKSHITAHILKHMNIFCKLCSQYFSCKKELEEHFLKEDEICEICDKTFTCKKGLLIHLNIHRGLRYECNDCGDVFKMKSGLIRHIEKYHGEPKYICDHCDKRFSLKCDLRVHIKAQHLEILRCNICYKAFYSNYEFRKHKNTVCIAKKHKCDICDESFARPYQLYKHKRVHKNNHKTFECPLCEKRYNYKNGLVRHTKLCHDLIESTSNS